MPRHVALLRGINLGQHNRVSMAKLRDVLVDLGYSDVTTHLQSGNAIFTSPGKTSLRTLEGHIHHRIAQDLGLDVAVLVITGRQLATIVEKNPLQKPGRDPAKLMVVFLWEEPSAAILRTIDPDEFAPEEFAVSGRAIYLWLPRGTQGSKLVGSLTDKKLGVTATIRSWRTVTKLAELTSG